MSQEDCLQISRHLVRLPLLMDLGELVPQRRRRYFWANWTPLVREGVSLEARPHCVRVKLSPQSTLAPELWAITGWEPVYPSAVHPTLTRPCPVPFPRWRTPGDWASPAALKAWVADSHRRPPLAYEQRFQMRHVASGRLRQKTNDELEILAGFDQGWTLQCMSSKARKADPAGFEDTRGELLGNAYSPMVMAFLLGELLSQQGYLDGLVNVTELAQRCVRLVPHPASSAQERASSSRGLAAPPPAKLESSGAARPAKSPHSRTDFSTQPRCQVADGPCCRASVRSTDQVPGGASNPERPRSQPSLEQPWQKSGCSPRPALNLVKWLLRHQTPRGLSIMNFRTRGCSVARWLEVPADWLEWKVIMSIPWRQACSHIGVCEARARHFSVRWRLRSPASHGCVHLHLLDSQVNLAQLSKGRCCSRRMAHVHMKASAALVACDSKEALAYTSSSANPANGPSRDRRAWATFRRQRRLVFSKFSKAATSTRRSLPKVLLPQQP